MISASRSRMMSCRARRVAQRRRSLWAAPVGVNVTDGSAERAPAADSVGAVHATRRSVLLRHIRRASIRPVLLEGAIVLWSLITAPFAVFMALNTERDWALIALAGGPLAFALRRRPYLAAATLVVGATVLRLSFIGLSSSDPIPVSLMAAERAFAGGNPYGASYGATELFYPYGPLGLLTYQAGIPGELLATVATSAILAWGGAWITLALFNGWFQFLYMASIGNNDYSVGFLTLLALVLLVARPRMGLVLLAAAIAVKPYAAAWAIPAAVFAGWGAALAGIATSLVLWGPVLFIWGIPSFAQSVLGAESSRASLGSVPSWAFADVPVLRLLVIPFSLAAFWWRTWRGVLLLGSLGFLAFLGFGPRAPQPYLAFLLPIVGMAIESGRPARRSAQDGVLGPAV